MTIVKENFENIVEECMPGTSFTVNFYNESEQELHIRTKLFTRKCLMQLIGECDRQRLECYVSSAQHSRIKTRTRATFVAVKE